MARGHRPACEHRRSGAGAVNPPATINLPPALMKELDAIAAAAPWPYFWKQDEIDVLLRYARKISHRKTLLRIMQTAFPGRRRYTMGGIDNTIKRYGATTVENR